MSHPLDFLIENAMKQAERKGELQNLPGAGKPLDLKPEAKDAVVNRLLTQNHAKPPAVILREQISAENKVLAGLTDPDERKAQMRKLADLQMRLAMEQEAFRKFG